MLNCFVISRSEISKHNCKNVCKSSLRYFNLNKILIFFLFRFYPDDPYYCGLRARVPNFAKDRARKASRVTEEVYASGNRNGSRMSRDPVPKRRSIAHADRHQPTFSSLYQLNQVNDPRSSLYQRLHHHSYNMTSSPHHRQSIWHARSYESGIG